MNDPHNFYDSGRPLSDSSAGCLPSGWLVPLIGVVIIFAKLVCDFLVFDWLGSHDRWIQLLVDAAVTGTLVFVALHMLYRNRAHICQRTAHHLEETAARYRAFFYQNCAAMLLIDPATGRIENANSAACHFYGYTLAHMKSMRISDINALPTEEIQARMAQAHQRKMNSFVFPHKLANGEIRDVEVFSGPVEWGGKVVLLSIIHDITEQEQGRQALEQERSRLFELLNNLPAIVYLIGPDYRFHFVNRSFIQTFGHPGEKTCYQVFQETEVPCPNCPVMEVIDRQENNESERSLSGGKFYRVYDYPFTDPDGTELGLGLMVDVSRQKQAEREIRQARDVAERANRTKSQFLANMSHEIRTPMNGMMGMMDLVLEADLDEESREYLELAKESAGTLLHLMNEMLDLSKLEAGTLTVVDEVYDLPEFIAAEARRWQWTAAEKGLTISSSVASDLPRHLLGDPHRLRQILNNLLSNAIKFTERGDIALRARRVVADNTLVIQVTDQGCGIPEEMQQEIFGLFQQVDGSTTRRTGGAGLGLAIAQQLAHRMDGKIEVESVPHQGSTFRLVIPLNEAAADPMPVLPQTPLSESSAVGDGLTVLVADDNEISHRLVQQLLTRRGHQVLSAQSGEEAWQTVQQEEVDLVLMDIQMPVMGGVEATRKIRQWEREGGHHRTPIVAMTANVMPDDRDQYGEVGMDGCLAKPFKLSDMLEILECVREGNA